MPELPEVEVVRRGLASHITGKEIIGVEIRHPRPVRNNAVDLACVLLGRRFLLPKRRGKFLWLPLSDDTSVIAHLGMSGQFRVLSAEAKPHQHSRVILQLADGRALHFVDQRMFGHVTWQESAAQPQLLAHIALDPFDQNFDFAGTAAILAAKDRGIKRMLLDQNLVSGIGNIYADEALWRAGVHGERRGIKLGKQKIIEILQAAREVMQNSLAQGGTSFDALYVNVNGESGYFERSLQAYGRVDRPCSRCGTLIRREIFMNRSSYSCPKCQPAPRIRQNNLVNGGKKVSKSAQPRKLQQFSTEISETR